MTYTRVIPRDLFNEASLLKCLGKLYLVTENLAAVQFVHVGNAFNIEQDQSDGSLYCFNIKIVVNGRAFYHRRPLNSRDDWPLWLYPKDADDFPAFDDDGNLSPEFKALLT